MTEWRVCQRFPDYEISEDGKLRRPVFSGRPTMNNRLLGGQMVQGYLRYIMVGPDGRQHQAGAHKLVCEAWHGPQPSPGHLTAHWDGNPLNNHFTNLRWATGVENAADTERHGKTPRGARNGRSVLTPDSVRLIRKRSAGGESGMQIAASLGVSHTTIRFVLIGRTWSHVQ